MLGKGNVMIFSLLKIGCLSIYALAMASFMGMAIPFEAGHTLQRIAIAMLLIHAVEMVVKFKQVRLYPGALWMSVLLTLLYGLLHWKPLEDAQTNSAPLTS